MYNSTEISNVWFILDVCLKLFPYTLYDMGNLICNCDQLWMQNELLIRSWCVDRCNNTDWNPVICYSKWSHDNYMSISERSHFILLIFITVLINGMMDKPHQPYFCNLRIIAYKAGKKVHWTCLKIWLGCAMIKQRQSSIHFYPYYLFGRKGRINCKSCWIVYINRWDRVVWNYYDYAI